MNDTARLWRMWMKRNQSIQGPVKEIIELPHQLLESESSEPVLT